MLGGKSLSLCCDVEKIPAIFTYLFENYNRFSIKNLLIIKQNSVYAVTRLIPAVSSQVRSVLQPKLFYKQLHTFYIYLPTYLLNKTDERLQILS